MFLIASRTGGRRKRVKLLRVGRKMWSAIFRRTRDTLQLVRCVREGWGGRTQKEEKDSAPRSRTRDVRRPRKAKKRDKYKGSENKNRVKRGKSDPEADSAKLLAPVTPKVREVQKKTIIIRRYRKRHRPSKRKQAATVRAGPLSREKTDDSRPRGNARNGDEGEARGSQIGGATSDSRSASRNRYRAKETTQN